MAGLAIRTFTGLILTFGGVVATQAQSTTRSPSRVQPRRAMNQQPVYQQPIQQQQPVYGQPIQQQPIQQGSATKNATGSTTRGANQGSVVSPVTASLGLQGYCPVCVVEMKQWMKGNPNIQATYDGKNYYFPGEKQRQMFLANPAKYTPALGGDCAVCLVNMKQRMPGSIHHSALNNGRLYLFPGAKQKEMFVADPGKYNQADVAINGECVVCRVEMNKQMPGKPEISTVHNGMKYQFMSDEQRKMFNMNPSKYVSGAMPK